MKKSCLYLFVLTVYLCCTACTNGIKDLDTIESTYGKITFKWEQIEPDCSTISGNTCHEITFFDNDQLFYPEFPFLNRYEITSFDSITFLDQQEKITFHIEFGGNNNQLRIYDFLPNNGTLPQITNLTLKKII